MLTECLHTANWTILFLIQNTTLGALNMKQYQDLDQFQYGPPCFVHCKKKRFSYLKTS